MQGTLWEWNMEKLEGVLSQILVTCPLQAVRETSGKYANVCVIFGDLNRFMQYKL